MSSPDLVVAGRVPAALVELAVGRQVRLRRDAEQLAAVDHDGAVVEAVAVAQRRADDEHREEIVGCLDQARDRRLDGVEHGILHHEVVDRVPGEAQLGEDRDGDGVGVAVAGGGEHGLGVRRPGRRSRPGSCRPRRARSRAGTRSRTGGSCAPVCQQARRAARERGTLSGPARTIEETKGNHAIHPGRGAHRLERERPQGRGRVRVRLAARRSTRGSGASPPSRSPRTPRSSAPAGWAASTSCACSRATAATFGDGVVEIAETRSADADGLAEAVARTQAALASDADVIYQAAFATHEFVGFADFLVRDEDGRWIVQDTQARPPRARDRAHAAVGIRRPARPARCRRVPTGSSCCSATARVSVHDRRRSAARLRAAPRAAARARSPTAASTSGSRWPAIAWGDPRGELGVVACGRCATCDAEVVAARDLLLVAGMRPVQRDRLRTAGIATIDELADTPARARRG